MNGLLDVEAAGGLSVYGAGAVPGAREARAALVRDGVPGLLAVKDPTLWGEAAEAVAGTQLGWVDATRRARELLPELAELRAELTGAAGAGIAELTGAAGAAGAAGAGPTSASPTSASLTGDVPTGDGDLHVVLAGMGGSSLAPEVLSRTLGRPLTVLDTTDPGRVRAVLADRLERTVVVVSSKSGSTVETDSHRRAYWQTFLDAGMSEAEAGRRFVVVTDPGSPLELTGRAMGALVIPADPEVGGRFSALTASGLVPAALAGVDVVELLDQAEALAPALGRDEDNPALALGAALGAAALMGRDRVALSEDGSGIEGLGGWVEQLVAESTGKGGRGLLPVVLESPTAPGATGPDVLNVTVGGALLPGTVPGGGVPPHLAVNGPLGAQFLVWQTAVALAARILGVNPFDQPDVAESKDNTARILDAGLPAAEPSFVEGAVQAYGAPGLSTVADALRALLDGVGAGGYLAVMAYLDQVGDAAAAQLRPLLATAAGRPVTFGWGPRLLHSAGQYHKAGPQEGCFLQVTGAVTEDLPVPGRRYTFGQLHAAQAAGDRQALAARGRPLLHLHLTDRAAGLDQLLTAAKAVT